MLEALNQSRANGNKVPLQDVKLSEIYVTEYEKKVFYVRTFRDTKERATAAGESLR